MRSPLRCRRPLTGDRTPLRGRPFEDCTARTTADADSESTPTSTVFTAHDGGRRPPVSAAGPSTADDCSAEEQPQPAVVLDDRRAFEVLVDAEDPAGTDRAEAE